ncbi:f77eaddb-ac7d-443e-be13-e5aad7689fce [Sclerotinia trifoliorum]|uniref:F77eaddb-ac7d-443e-be13-e5aad7689fce n=1 Tax=Sclerotinia trifoliorum TaxID=28548 RepID=A0A8H2W5V6_9HELO|nr:f77eaddb-ac7d-443e-be13-e5aad7689fce [Sclerotinia trifoliorum]
MAGRAEIDASDLVQAVQSGSKVQELVDRIKHNFNLDSIAEDKGCSRVEGVDEFSQSKKIANIVALIVGRPRKTLHSSRGVALLVFQNRTSNLEKIVGKENCGIFIPVDIAGSGEATLEETVLKETNRRTIFKFQTGSELLIIRRCSIWLPAQSTVLCVVRCARKDKRPQTVQVSHSFKCDFLSLLFDLST